MAYPLADPRLLGKYRLTRRTLEPDIAASIDWLPFDARPLRIQPWGAFGHAGDGRFTPAAAAERACVEALRTLDADWILGPITATHERLDQTLALDEVYRARTGRSLPHFRRGTVIRIGSASDLRGSDEVTFDNSAHLPIAVRGTFAGALQHTEFTLTDALTPRWTGLLARINADWFRQLVVCMAAGEEFDDDAILAAYRKTRRRQLGNWARIPSVTLGSDQRICVTLRPYEDAPIELVAGQGVCESGAQGSAAEMLALERNAIEAIPGLAALLMAIEARRYGCLDDILAGAGPAAVEAWRANGF